MVAEAGFTTDVDCARQLDAADPLAAMRAEFNIPPAPDGSESVYLVGNSLGAQPRASRSYVGTELDRWSRMGVRGHRSDRLAWVTYHELLVDQMARIVGGRSDEVVAMNSLTVNLHLLMVSFYRPTRARHKVIIERHAFPSDHFAVESQISQRGFDPDSSLVVLSPRPGEETLRRADIIDTIRQHGDELALVMLPGVHYYTGQVLDMAAITEAGHGVGAMVGFDLAHAVGNVMLDLHQWNVDFAAWCTYKYLNGGPGGVGGAFVHQRHVEDQGLPKLLGWWGTAMATRFEMDTKFEAVPTVESWQLSNPPILSMAALRASLDLIDRAGGISAMRRKSEKQIRYTDFLVDALLEPEIVCITPRPLAQRGCQFSLRVTASGIDGRWPAWRATGAIPMSSGRLPCRSTIRSPTFTGSSRFSPGCCPEPAPTPRLGEGPPRPAPF